MTDLTAAVQSLQQRGYTVHRFATGREAADYLNEQIDGVTVGIGGSSTVDALGLYERLSIHNTVFWHWKQDASAARRQAMEAQVYLSSVNALAQTGEMICIDGVGNRVASLLFGHQRVYLLIGANKLAESFDEALWRARNVAAPQRARQLGAKTPCAARADRCYDCRVPGRICRGEVILQAPMLGMQTEVLMIDEELGL